MKKIRKIRILDLCAWGWRSNREIVIKHARLLDQELKWVKSPATACLRQRRPTFTSRLDMDRRTRPATRRRCPPRRSIVPGSHTLRPAVHRCRRSTDRSTAPTNHKGRLDGGFQSQILQYRIFSRCNSAFRGFACWTYLWLAGCFAANVSSTQWLPEFDLTLGSPGFSTNWKNCNRGCKLPSKVQPGLLFYLRIWPRHQKFHRSNSCSYQSSPFSPSVTPSVFYSTPHYSHCKRFISYSNSVCLSICHTPVFKICILICCLCYCVILL